MSKSKKSSKKKKYQDPIQTVEVIKNGALAIIAGLAVNIMIYYFGVIFGVLGTDEINPGTDKPISVTDVITMTLFWMLLGLLVFLIFVALMENPTEIYRTVAISGLVFSFILPLGVENAGIFTIFFLDLMHIASSTSILYFLTTKKLF